MLFLDVTEVDGEWRILQFGGFVGGLLDIAPIMQGIIPGEFIEVKLKYFFNTAHVCRVLCVIMNLT